MRTSLVGCVGVVGLMVAACGGATEVPELDQSSTDISSAEQLKLVKNKLGELLPVGEHNPILDFKLRRGVTFHDGTPFVARADRPDRPDFVGAAPNGFLDVRVADIHRVDIAVAVDHDRRKPHWQRHAGNQVILGHPIVRDHLELLPAVPKLDPPETPADAPRGVPVLAP